MFEKKKKIDNVDVAHALLGAKTQNFISKEFDKQVKIEYLTTAVLERVNVKINDFLQLKLKEIESQLNAALVKADLNVQQKIHDSEVKQAKVLEVFEKELIKLKKRLTN